MGTIADLRRQAKMTQQQLAVALGTSVTSVASWEQGKYDPNARQFRALVKVLGVALDELDLPSEVRQRAEDVVDLSDE